MKREIICVFLSLILAIGLMPTVTFAASDDVIRFPDINFEAAVREQINKPMGAITRGNVEKLQKLV